MKVVVQRSKEASVVVDGKVVGQIKSGLVLLVGFTKGDNLDIIKQMTKKIINLRIFDDEDGVMNISLKDLNKEILLVSQFTLYADASKGNRPSYINALGSSEAKVLYDAFEEELRSTNLKVETGVFKADMKVSLINDGPITIILEK